MCGRYTFYAGEDLFDRFHLDPNGQIGEYLNHNYTVTPGSFMPVITSGEKYNQFSLMHWGLIPSWAKDSKTGLSMFNARADTVTVKPSFKVPFHRRRCLIPATGFYEWKTDNRLKIPFYYTLKDQSLFSFAGLWDKWLDPHGSIVDSYTIITTDPNSLIKSIHDRMPVILKSEDEKIWLNNTSSETSLLSLLKPYPDKLMASANPQSSS